MFAHLVICLSLFAAEDAPPNVLWISAEDISPDLGCYGDRYAITPTIDRLAARGVRFERCFTHAGVCAPSRSGLITGRFPPSIGTHHMRCQAVSPADVKCFPEYLRAAGYYCTNNVKTDYQFPAPPTAWDENSNQADWRGRKPGQPFFCVINFITTHESQIRNPSEQTQRLVAQLKPEERHDPAGVTVPPYYPDTPTVRRDLANYYDNLTALDHQVAEVLARLEADGLADDTIVWFWGDHGRGMTRCKRWLYDSGTRTPLIIHVPERWRTHVGLGDPGTASNDLVAFLDFAPTMLSLAGVPIPKQLHGQAFLGPARQPPRQYVYGHRDRMDETYDLIRSVRDTRYKYIRNFRPDLSYAQPIDYMDQMPTIREMRQLHKDGKLTGPPALFFRPTKPVEELFDTQIDPHELTNLADEPQHRETLLRLRAECERWMRFTGDLGLIPEPVLDQWQRPGDKWQHAPAPQITTRALDDKDSIEFTLRSGLPGASLHYRLGSSPQDVKGKKGWTFYTQPFTAKIGQTLAMQTCRIGYRDSEPLVLPVKATLPPTNVTEDPDWPVHRPANWRERLDAVVALRQHDLSHPTVAERAYREGLFADDEILRYWSILGLDWLRQQGQEIDITGELARLREKDESPLVRIAAAESSAKQGRLAPALPLLERFLKTLPEHSGRLQAMTALQNLGEQARPVLPSIRAAAQDGEYVSRVAKATLIELGEPPGNE